MCTNLTSDVGGVPEGGLTDVAIEVLHLLLTYLLYTPQKDVGIGEHQKQAFLDTLRKGERYNNLSSQLATRVRRLFDEPGGEMIQPMLF